MKYIIYLVFCLNLIGCAHADSNKPITSQWVGQSIGWTLFIDTKHIYVAYQPGGACLMDAAITNNTITMKSAVAVTTQIGMPGCDQFNGTWTYVLGGQNNENVVFPLTIWTQNGAQEVFK